MTGQAQQVHFSRNGDGSVSYLSHAEKFIDLWRDIASSAGASSAGASDADSDSAPRVPAKADFSIRRLQPFLPSYYLAEWTDEGDLVNRLVGSALDDRLGSPHTGVSFLENYEGAQRRYFETFWKQLLDTPCGVMTGRTLHQGPDRKLRMVGTALPLTDAAGDVCYLCGTADIVRDFQEETGVKVGERRVYIDYVQYIDLGFGIPANRPDPAEFNALTDQVATAAE